MPRDPYEVLGVGRDVDEQQLKKSFRRLARELHPDVNADDPEAAEKFKEAAEAYEILSDPERRATYDRFGHQGLRSGGYAPNFDSFGSLGDLFGAFFGDSGIFGGEEGAARGRGADIAIAAAISLTEAAAGKAIDIEYQAVERCGACHGNGAQPGTPIVTCERCRGAGRLQGLTRTPFGEMVRTQICERCEGAGKVPEVACKECGGRGQKAALRQRQVEIPAGIADGQSIRISGAGHEGSAGATAGDLYVQVSVRDDPRFVRQGQDLFTAVDVPSPLAALGTELSVPTLDGEQVLAIEPGTQPGELLSIRGAGMPGLGRARRGDLKVVVNVITPRRLTSEQRKLYEQLGDSLTEENLSAEQSLLAKLRRALGRQAA